MKIPPSRRQQIQAVGGDHRNQEIKIACCTPENWDATFEPKHNLVPGDWLSGPGQSEQRGQTFNQFKKRKPKRPRVQQKIYLVPIGKLTSDDGENSVDIEAIAEYTRAYFMAPVEILEGIDDSAVQNFRGSRRTANGDILQLRTDACHRSISRVKPDDAYCAVGVTMYDLFPGDEWNFVFGEACPHSKTGVFSFARYRENINTKVKEDFVSDQFFLKRCCQVVVHEIGHLYGIEHCIWFQCCMNGANHLYESDSQPIHLCPVDLRKLQLISLSPDGKRFSIIERYNTLKSWYRRHEFSEDTKWIDSRLSELGHSLSPECDGSEEKDHSSSCSDPGTTKKHKTDDLTLFAFLLRKFRAGEDLFAMDLADNFDISVGRAKRAVKKFKANLCQVRAVLDRKEQRSGDELALQILQSIK